MRRLNIGIDIDGTMTSPYHFLPYLNEMYNKDYTDKDCTVYNWEHLYGAKEEDLLAKFHNEYMHSYIEAECVEGSKEILEELYKNHNLYFVTARSENLTDVTKDWLNKHKLTYIDVHLLGSHYKVDKAAELNCDVFIEDNPSNAMQLAEAGIKVFLIDTYYNKDTEHKNIIRVNNWNEIKEIIDKDLI